MGGRPAHDRARRGGEEVRRILCMIFSQCAVQTTGADARAVMDLLHYAIKRENLTRSRNGKTRISYQIKTSAGRSGQAEGMGQETASISS